MINMALYKREMKGSIKLFILFGAIITMYVSIIIHMYDPQMMESKQCESFGIYGVLSLWIYTVGFPYVILHTTW